MTRCASCAGVRWPTMATGQSCRISGEWPILDNLCVVTVGVTGLHRNPARPYFREPTMLTACTEAGHARIDAGRHRSCPASRQPTGATATYEVVSHCRRLAPLTIGEPWARPGMLKRASYRKSWRSANEVSECHVPLCSRRREGAGHSHPPERG